MGHMSPGSCPNFDKTEYPKNVLGMFCGGALFYVSSGHCIVQEISLIKNTCLLVLVVCCLFVCLLACLFVCLFVCLFFVRLSVFISMFLRVFWWSLEFRTKINK